MLFLCVFLGLCVCFPPIELCLVCFISASMPFCLHLHIRVSVKKLFVNVSMLWTHRNLLVNNCLCYYYNMLIITVCASL